VREEADELARAAASEPDGRVAEEAADLLYHLEVLLLSRGVPLEAALETLNDRRT
jgi:phosphoribosyl-ATP pyrophosphohydrolase/phosphoribosyl-AMP cyclohydrolase